MNGQLELPKFDGQEIAPGIFIIGEPTPIAGTDKLRALAQIGSALGLVELRFKFAGATP